MKYVRYLFIIFFLSIDIVLAKQNIDISNKIISFDNIENYNLQSFTVVDDRLIIVLVNYDNDAGIIKEYSLLNNKELRNIEINKVGHGNGITYNNNKLYILNSSGDDTIYVYDSNSLEYINEFKVNLPIRSITYVNEEDIYLVRTYITGFKLDNNFKLISNVPFISNLSANPDIARQDWTYYNGYLYYANWSWKRLGGDGANMIYIYNLKGKLVDSLYTKDNLGELEDISFYNNKMILGFNGYDDKINFYLEDLVDIKIDEEEIKEDKVQEDEIKNKYINYILFAIGILFLVFIIILGIKKSKLIK